jgi:hypothetical protein
MSEDRLRLRAANSSFHFKLMNLVQTDETTPKPNINNSSTTKTTDIKSNGRDFSALKEEISLTKLEKPYHKKDIIINTTYDENTDIKDEKSAEFNIENFPTLINQQVTKDIKWVSDKKLDINPEYFKTVSDNINVITRQKQEQQSHSEIIEKQSFLNELEKETRLAEHIKKVKKLYEKDYLVHDEKDYLEEEIFSFFHQEENSEQIKLYDEMLEEIRNRDLSIEFDDPEYYYTVYDEETPYYEAYKYMELNSIN